MQVDKNMSHAEVPLLAKQAKKMETYTIFKNKMSGQMVVQKSMMIDIKDRERKLYTM